MAARPNLDPDTGLALALAVVGSSTAPMVLPDDDFRVVAARGSFFSALHIDPKSAVSRVGAVKTQRTQEARQLFLSQ
jgi:hypothetical protein